MEKLLKVFNKIKRKLIRIYSKVPLLTQLLLMLIYLNINWFMQSKLMENTDNIHRNTFELLYYIIIVYNIIGILLAVLGILYWICYLIERRKEYKM